MGEDMNKFSNAVLYTVAVLNVFAIWMFLSIFVPRELVSFHIMASMLPITLMIQFLNKNLRDDEVENNK